MSAFRNLTVTETRVYLREPAGVFWGIAFPTVLLVLIGMVFPGARDPSPDLDGFRLVDLYAPVVLTLGLATLGLATLPVILATYRERGVLRRLATTPAHPRLLVGSQLVLHGALAVVASAVALATGAVVLGIPMPGDPVGFVVAFLLAAAALLAVGLVVGAVARTAAAGQAIGLAVYFPMLFFAGVYFPREVMSPGLRAVSDLTPTGAAVEALGHTWVGLAPPVSSLLVIAAYAVVAGLLATLWFRWE